MKRIWLFALALVVATPLVAQFPAPPGTRIVGATPGAITPSGLTLIGLSANVLPVQVDAFCGLKASGVCGDGTDDTPAIQAAENNTPSGGTLRFTPGLTYTVNTTSNAAGVPKVVNSHIWDLTGATIKYGGASNLTTGSDGGSVPVIAVLSTPFRMIAGTIDGNGKAAWLLAFQDAQTGGALLEFTTLKGTLEASSTWSGLAYQVSKDVSGIPIVGRFGNLSGQIIRVNAPIANSGDTITSHSTVSVTVVGNAGSAQGNATGFAIATNSGSDLQAELITMGGSAPGGSASPGVGGGIPAFINNTGAQVSNNTWADMALYDLGARYIELYGAFLPVPQRQTFSSGGTYTPSWFENAGAVSAMVHMISLTANVAVTIANPSNGGVIAVDRAGFLRFVIFNNSGGALTTPVIFTGSQYITTGPVNPSSGSTTVVDFVFDFNRTKWIETSRSSGQVGVIFQKSGLSTSSTSDVSVTSFPLPGASLGTNGNAVRILMRGNAVTQAGVPNIKFGATVTCTATITAGNVYELDAIVTRTGATAQVGVCTVENGTVIAANTRTTPAETLSGNITIDFRGSVTAGGTLNVDYAQVELLDVP